MGRRGSLGIVCGKGPVPGVSCGEREPAGKREELGSLGAVGRGVGGIKTRGLRGGVGELVGEG